MNHSVDSGVAAQQASDSSSAISSASSSTTSPSTKTNSESYDPAADCSFEPGSRLDSLCRVAKDLGMRAEDLDVFLRAGMKLDDVPKDRMNRASMLAYLKRRSEAPPKWVLVSGLWPDSENTDFVDVRRRKVRALYKAAVLFIRKALKRHEIDPDKAERSVFWDPVVDVCKAMEISQSALSRYCKELTGNSLTQVMDSVRAEGLKGKLKNGIRKVVQGSKFKSYRTKPLRIKMTQAANSTQPR